MPEVTVTNLMLLRLLTRLGEHRALVAPGFQLLPRPTVASVSAHALWFNSSVLILEPHQRFDGLTADAFRTFTGEFNNLV